MTADLSRGFCFDNTPPALKTMPFRDGVFRTLRAVILRLLWFDIPRAMRKPRRHHLIRINVFL